MPLAQAFLGLSAIANPLVNYRSQCLSWATRLYVFTLHCRLDVVVRQLGTCLQHFGDTAGVRCALQRFCIQQLPLHVPATLPRGHHLQRLAPTSIGATTMRTGGTSPLKYHFEPWDHQLFGWANCSSVGLCAEMRLVLKQKFVKMFSVRGLSVWELVPPLLYGGCAHTSYQHIDSGMASLSSAAPCDYWLKQ